MNHNYNIIEIYQSTIIAIKINVMQ